MFEPLTSRAAVALLNRWLAREAWARERLSPFAGRVARLALPPFAIVFEVTAEGLLAGHAGDQPPDVSLTANSAALPWLLVDRKALVRDVQLSGDAEFAQALGFVLQNLKPEPEEDLAPWIGDAAAVQLVAWVRAAFAQALETGKRFSETATDYLTIENPMLASQQELDEFAQAVGELRDANDRLQARLDHWRAEAPAQSADAADVANVADGAEQPARRQGRVQTAASGMRGKRSGARH